MSVVLNVILLFGIRCIPPRFMRTLIAYVFRFKPIKWSKKGKKYLLAAQAARRSISVPPPPSSSSSSSSYPLDSSSPHMTSVVVEPTSASEEGGENNNSSDINSSVDGIEQGTSHSYIYSADSDSDDDDPQEDEQDEEEEEENSIENKKKQKNSQTSSSSNSTEEHVPYLISVFNIPVDISLRYNFFESYKNNMNRIHSTIYGYSYRINVLLYHMIAISMILIWLAFFSLSILILENYTLFTGDNCPAVIKNSPGIWDCYHLIDYS